MGKIVLAALVGIWMFNLARLIAGGLPGHTPADLRSSYVVPAAEASTAATSETLASLLPDGVALEVRSATAMTGANTTITARLVLAQPSSVDLDLYDSSGRRILTQSSRRLPAGRSTVQLQSVERLAEGRYWIRARVGDDVATQMVTIRE